ncbi:hypothetical protein AAMO2058_001089600 [Amorphochlora amoebiformis]
MCVGAVPVYAARQINTPAIPAVLHHDGIIYRIQPKQPYNAISVEGARRTFHKPIVHHHQPQHIQPNVLVPSIECIMSEKKFMMRPKAPVYEDIKKPKRPKTAYNCFQIAEKRRLKRLASSCPVHSSQFAVSIGVRWKSMSPADRQVYKIEADRDRERYQREMVIYQKRLLGQAHPDVHSPIASPKGLGLPPPLHYSELPPLGLPHNNVRHSDSPVSSPKNNPTRNHHRRSKRPRSPSPPGRTPTPPELETFGFNLDDTTATPTPPATPPLLPQRKKIKLTTFEPLDLKGSGNVKPHLSPISGADLMLSALPLPPVQSTAKSGPLIPPGDDLPELLDSNSDGSHEGLSTLYDFPTVDQLPPLLDVPLGPSNVPSQEREGKTPDFGGAEGKDDNPLFSTDLWETELKQGGVWDEYQYPLWSLGSTVKEEF